MTTTSTMKCELACSREATITAIDKLNKLYHVCQYCYKDLVPMGLEKVETKEK